MKLKRRIEPPALVAWAAAVVLLVAVFLPWYADTYTFTTDASNGTNESCTTSLWLGTAVSIPLGACGLGASNWKTTYSVAGWNNTGSLYQTMQYVVIGGVVAALAAGAIFLLADPRTSRGRTLGVIFVAIAAGLALAAPITIWVAQPNLAAQDIANSHATGLSTTFFGSCTGCGYNAPGLTISETWGPALGWYLSFTAGGLLLLGLGLLERRRARRPPPIDDGSTAGKASAGDSEA